MYRYLKGLHQKVIAGLDKIDKKVGGHFANLMGEHIDKVDKEIAMELKRTLTEAQKTHQTLPLFKRRQRMSEQEAQIGVFEFAKNLHGIYTSKTTLLVLFAQLFFLSVCLSLIGA